MHAQNTPSAATAKTVSDRAEDCFDAALAFEGLGAHLDEIKETAFLLSRADMTDDQAAKQAFRAIARLCEAVQTQAADFGSSAPSVTYIVAQSPGGYGPDGKFYPRDSLVLIDELATNKRDRPSEGLGWTVPILAEEIVAMCKRWCVQARGVADDAIFARTGHGSGSIADEFTRCGVHFRPAQKADRLTGWNVMRRLLADAGKPDVPGLYVSRACEYFWSTVPYLARDQKRIEDVDSSGPDHAADAVRYGCLRRDDRMRTVGLSGI